jgi:hypothetical protein
VSSRRPARAWNRAAVWGAGFEFQRSGLLGVEGWAERLALAGELHAQPAPPSQELLDAAMLGMLHFADKEPADPTVDENRGCGARGRGGGTAAAARNAPVV